jgi:lipid-binding SYLF domain-containing protein
MRRIRVSALFGVVAIALCTRALAAEPPAQTEKAGPSAGNATPLKREPSEAMKLARAALDKVATTYQVDGGKIRDLVRGSQGFAVLQDVVKAGFLFATIHGHGFLVYRQPDGRWGPPLMLEVNGTSIGPQIGARVSDVLVVFKDAASMQKLLKGELPHGLITPSGSVLYGGTEATTATPGIVTYSLHRGMLMGQSVDEYRVRLSEQDNLTLYGDVLRSGEFVDIKRVGPVMPAPVHLFVDHINAQFGEPAHEMEWKAGGPAPRP